MYALVMWQRTQEAYLHRRRSMLEIVLSMISADNAPEYIKALIFDSDTASLARRLEYALFQKANSPQEYFNLATLGRRLEYLGRFATQLHATGKKRNFEFMASDKTKRRRISKASKTVGAFFFHGGHSELTCQVFSFLSSVDVIRLRGVNRYSAHGVLEFVESLHLTTKKLTQILDSESAISFLSQFPRLRTMELMGEINGDAQTVAADIGATIMTQLGDAMANGVCRKLEKLAIRSFFFNQSRSNILTSMTKALHNGACRQLKELDLSDNYLSDCGAIAIAELLVSRGCPSLRSVELRNNYIEQPGAEAIARSLESDKCAPIQYLGLAGNILGARFVPSAIKCGNCATLQHLNLDDNFISFPRIK